MIPPPPRSTLFPYTTLFRSTNFLAMQPGTTTPIQNFTPAQLSAAFSSYNNLQWSVFGSFFGDSSWQGFPSHTYRSEEHTSELQSHSDLVCRLLLEKKKNKTT